MTDDDRKQRLRALIGWLADKSEADLCELREWIATALAEPDHPIKVEWITHRQARLAELRSELDQAAALRADAAASTEALAAAVIRLNNRTFSILGDQDVGGSLHYIAVSLIAAGEDELADRLFDAQQHFRFAENIERRPW